MMKKLTQRQLTTYELIKNNSLINKETTTEEIISNYPYSNERKDGYIKNSNEKVHDICIAIWSDIDTLNKSVDIDKIIIKDSKALTFKLAANKDEAMIYIDKFKNKALKAFKRYWALIEKINKDGQGEFNNDTLHFKETFLEMFEKE